MKQNTESSKIRLNLARAVAALTICSGLFSRCANTTTPLGGPTDSLPPVVTSMLPLQGQTKFAEKKIFIEFDEYVQLKDVGSEFFVSPAMKKKPTLTIRGRGVQVSITDDSLKENQTYALNFGSSVRDNNEGNVLYGLRYVFSTGESIDSMIMSGYVADGKSGDSASKALLFFYDALCDTIPEYDSILFKKQPDVIARAENNGIFVAQNLKPIDYKVYAVQDKNKNGTYEPGVDKVGFLDEYVNPANFPGFAYWVDSLRKYPTADPQVYMRLFMDKDFKRQNMTASERPLQNKIILRFGAPRPEIRSLVFDNIPEDSVVWEYMTKGRDTIALWLNMPAESIKDTLEGIITYMRHDSLNVLQPRTDTMKLLWSYVETREEKKEREEEEKARKAAEEAGEEYIPKPKANPFGFKVHASTEINPNRTIPIEFIMPLVSVDSAQIELANVVTDKEGNKTETPVGVRIEQDTANMRKWHISGDWESGGEYKLTIPAGVFVNVARQSNDTLRAEFKIMEKDKYATVYINLTGKTPESKYILTMMDKSGTILEERRDVSTGVHGFEYVPEGEISVRITEDLNGNGEWDSGDVIARRQPERVETYTSEAGDKAVPTRANWEVTLNMDMNKMFAPVTIESVIAKLESAERVRVNKLMEERLRKAEEKKRRGDEDENTGGGFSIGGALGSMKSKIGSVTNAIK
ncbi:MAG: Ig-like domain-containing protein [Rikenellaceae bacterium]|nr:Ig-like domain-containing protein [Rikenellaceae bacterium]